MFGGLDLKGSSSSAGTTTSAVAPAAASDTNGTTSNEKPTAATPPPSAFSFLNAMTMNSNNNSDAGTDGIPSPIMDNNNTANAGSSFGFLSAHSTTTTAAAPEPLAISATTVLVETSAAPPPAAATTSQTLSSFDFLQPNSIDEEEIAAASPLPQLTMAFRATSNNTGSSTGSSNHYGGALLDGLGGGTNAPPAVGDAKSVSSISRDSPPLSWTEPAASSLSLSSMEWNPPAPAAAAVHSTMGTGITFGGASAAGLGPKKEIKKRTRTAKIGAAAQHQPQSLPPPTPRMDQHRKAFPTTPLPSTTTTATTTTRNEAEEATRRAEEFLHEKFKETEKTTSTSHRVIRSMPSEEDDIIAAAKAAAAEAHKLEAQKTASRSSSTSGSGGFGSLFRSRAKSPPTPQPTYNNNNSSNSNRPPVSMSSSSHSLGSTTDLEPPLMAERLRKEQDDVKRAMAERQFNMMQQQQQRQINPRTISEDSADEIEEAPSSYEPVSFTASTTLPARSFMMQPPTVVVVAAAAPDLLSSLKPVTARDKLDDMLNDFRRQVERSVNEMTRLRQHRSGLLEERFVTNAKERLAGQQKARALLQQSSAVEQEDFELADAMSTTIDRHGREESEYAAILENIGRAIQELDKQKKACIDAVSQCFQDIKVKLTEAQKEQESADTKNATESLTKFSLVSKQLSAEHNRLQNDWKHLERDTELMAEERRELEKAISEQSGAFEKLRDQARAKLASVEEEMEDLRLLLKAKQDVAAELRTEAAGHDESVLKVRVKFSRQLTRLQKKEMTIKDNSDEWESEKKSFEHQKHQHEEQVKEHSEAMLARDTLLDDISKEVELADTFASIVAKEIGFEVNAGQDDPECDDELAQLQANVVKCEAAAGESKAALKDATTGLRNLEEEIETLSRQIPELEALKKLSAERRDFKTAGKASKDIKEAMSRLAECSEEIKGESASRKEAAEVELRRLELELEEARKCANEMERELGVSTMARLADNIKRLVATKEKVCTDTTNHSIPSVGAFVLDAQIKVLKLEGQIYGDKYGGWTELLTDIVRKDDAEAKDQSGSVPSALESTYAGDVEESVPVVSESQTNVENVRRSEDSGVTMDMKLSKFREVTKQLNDCEQELEAAVAEDDFEKAAQLDEVLQALLSEVQTLNMTDDEMALALEQTPDSEGPVSEEKAKVEVETLEHIDYVQDAKKEMVGIVDDKAVENGEVIPLDPLETDDGTNDAMLNNLQDDVESSGLVASELDIEENENGDVPEVSNEESVPSVEECGENDAPDDKGLSTTTDPVPDEVDDTN